MRTTLTIRDDLLAKAKVLAASQHRTIGSVMEEALEKLIEEMPPAKRERYTLPDFKYTGGLAPGVDLEDKDALEEILATDPYSAAP